MENKEPKESLTETPEQENKTRTKFPVRYLRELSVVIIGIAVTFLASGWITGCREKKELSIHLDSIEEELKANLESIGDLYLYYRQLYDLALFLNTKPFGEHTKAEIDRAATMENGVNILGIINYTVPLETASFESLKQSGTSRRIAKHPLWKDILKSYKGIDDVESMNEVHMATKTAYFYDCMKDSSIPGFNLFRLDLPQLYNYYRIPFMSHEVCKWHMEEIEQTIAQINKYRNK